MYGLGFNAQVVYGGRLLSLATLVEGDRQRACSKKYSINIIANNLELEAICEAGTATASDTSPRAGIVTVVNCQHVVKVVSSTCD